jgi:hypothetical protein
MLMSKARWSIADVIAEFADDAEWWNSTRQLTAIDNGIRSREKEAHKLLRETRAGDYRDIVRQFTSDGIKARAEIRERKRVLGLSDDEGRAWKAAVIRIIKRDFGDAEWQRINAEARAHVEEVMTLRSVPMGTGSVLGPVSSGGAMRER